LPEATFNIRLDGFTGQSPLTAQDGCRHRVDV
jgi:hypothetical protein